MNKKHRTPAGTSEQHSSTTKRNKTPVQQKERDWQFPQSVFDGKKGADFKQELAFYYGNPHLLPDRESFAEARVRLGVVPKDVKVQFDEDIFLRGEQKRPISDHEKYGVDPFVKDRLSSRQPQTQQRQSPRQGDAHLSSGIRPA